MLVAGAIASGEVGRFSCQVPVHPPVIRRQHADDLGHQPLGGLVVGHAATVNFSRDGERCSELEPHASVDPSAPSLELEMVWNDPEHLDLAGELDGQLIVARMKKRTFLLETRGFHWISEEPFNR